MTSSPGWVAPVEPRRLIRVNNRYRGPDEASSTRQPFRSGYGPEADIVTKAAYGEVAVPHHKKAAELRAYSRRVREDAALALGRALKAKLHAARVLLKQRKETNS